MAPDFLLRPMGSKSFMRLSLKKGAHRDLSRAACRKFGVFANVYMGRERRGEAPPVLLLCGQKAAAKGKSPRAME
jgi:hypothetical protein